MSVGYKFEKGVFEADVPKLARLLAGIMVALCAVFLIGLLIVFSDPNEIIFGVPFALKILLVLPFLAGAVALVVIFYIFLSWIKGYWVACARIHYMLIFFSVVGFLWFLYYWNLFGFKF